jgi:hypothetical protein
MLPHRYPPYYRFTGLQSGNVPAGDYAEFEPDGFLSLHGSALAWKDLDIGAVSLGGGASSPDLVAINGGSIQLPAFDGGVITEQLWGAKEIDHDYAEGTDIQVHCHWMPTTAGAGSVKWQMTYMIAKNGVAVGAENTVSVVQAAGGVAWVTRFANLAPVIPGAGLEIGNQIIFRFFRNPTDGSDDYAGDAVVTTIGFHIQVDSFGSRSISDK